MPVVSKALVIHYSFYVFCQTDVDAQTMIAKLSETIIRKPNVNLKKVLLK